MLSDGRRLGAHLEIQRGLVRAADRAIEIGATAIQIFSDNPTAWRRRLAPSPEIPAFRSRLAAGDVAPLVIHASYLVNLAGSDPAYHERSVAMLAAELRTARRFGASIVNVHIGSHGGAGAPAGIERLVTAIGRAIAIEDEPETAEDDGDGDGSANVGPIEEVPLELAGRAIIALENSAGSGSGLGVDIDELAAIAEALDRTGTAAGRVAFCVDTAHAWSAGVDLGRPAAIDAFVDAFDRRIGLDRLAVVHLNDSKSDLGSRLDRHEHIGAGRIGEAAMAHLLRHPRLAGPAWILETPGMDEGYDAINLERAKALARGEPLLALPPGAMTLKGSRAKPAPAAAPEPA